MSLDCLVLAFDNPNATLPCQYVVQSGDTLTAIAAWFGFPSRRDIYHHPDNEPFRKKRPNPDQKAASIFVSARCITISRCRAKF
jgi:hypothetical protein